MDVAEPEVEEPWELACHRCGTIHQSPDDLGRSCDGCETPLWNSYFRIMAQAGELEVWIESWEEPYAQMVQCVVLRTGHPLAAVWALQQVMSKIDRDAGYPEALPHVRGAELCLAVYRWFAVAGVHAGYRCCRAADMHTARRLKELVYAMVDEGLLATSAEDSPADFAGVIPAWLWFRNRRRRGVVRRVQRIWGGAVWRRGCRIWWWVVDLSLDSRTRTVVRTDLQQQSLGLDQREESPPG